MKKYIKRKIFVDFFFLQTQKNNVSEFNQYIKLDKMLYIIYANTDSLIKK